jgi:hypothetical protein
MFGHFRGRGFPIGAQGIPPLLPFQTQRSANQQLTLSDIGTLLQYSSGTFTQTYDPAAKLGNGWWVMLENVGTGVITHDPNASEYFDISGVTTAAQNPGDLWLLDCDGQNFRLQRLAGMNKQIYTSGSGNFTVPAGVWRIFVEIWGAGAGGNTNTFAGGGAGGYCAAWLNVTPGQTIAYAVGAAGTSGNPGTAGGNTTFSTLTANGGNISTSNYTGGTASGGDINIRGLYGTGNNITGAWKGGDAPRGGSGGFSTTGGTIYQSPTAPGGGGTNTDAGAAGQINIYYV